MFLDSNVIFSAVHSPQATPGRLLRYATSGTFRAVICSTVLREVVRNLDRKVGPRLRGLEDLIRAGTFEVMPDPPPPEVEVWAARGFGTDSIIVAAAFAADVDYLCTGDRGLQRGLPAYDSPFEIVSPSVLLSLLVEDQSSGR